MSMYKKVLVAVDVTDEADEVIAAAAEVAEKNEAQLCFVTAVQPIAYAYSGYEALSANAGFQEFEDQARSYAASFLSAKARQLGVDGDQVAVLVGRASAVIKDHAQEIGADLIVLGTHGQHGLGLLLGSTANGVLHGAPCDVLTIRIKD